MTVNGMITLGFGDVLDKNIKEVRKGIEIENFNYLYN
jgi:hypothetical protein